VSSETHVVLFNAVPLVALAAVYLGVAAAIVPNLWRQRGHTHVLDLAVGLTFPAIAVTAAILGAAVAREREPLVGHLWLSLAAVLITLAPALLFLARWGERALVLTGGARARAAVELVSLRDRELEAVTALSNELARARDAEAAARILLPKVQALLGVEFAALACIDERAEHAWGILALVEGEEADWWRDVAVDLRDEPSGIASAVFEVAPVTVFDVSTSRLVSPRLARAVGAKSGAWIPLVSEARVLGVLVLASTGANRAWTTEEISLAQAMAAEAALALDRFNSAAALADALDRERLVARISRRVRSELDVDALMRVATGEVGEALGATRCFIRVGETAEELRLGAEWHVENIAPVGELAVRLPVSNLAARDRRTTSIADVATAPELDDHTLGDRDDLIRFGTRSALAVPILVFDRMIGVVTVHRGEVHTWTQTEIELIEAVARELGLALHTARLLTENQRRLEQQAALLHAAQVVTSELELDVVLERLVEEMTRLFRADAADCYLYDERRRILRCAATYGLPASLVGFEFSPEHGLAGQAIAAGHAVSDDEYEALELRVPHEAYEGFARALSAPMTWGGHTRGVLGVGIRDGARRFDDADTELLEAYAGLAALALRNAESYEQRASQARVQRGFYRIASVLGEPISLDATVAAVAQAATEALGGQAAALVVPSPRGLSLAGSFQLPPELEAALRDGLPAGAEVLATAASERRVLTARAAQQDERFGGAWRELLASSDLSALLAVPIEEPRSDETALVIVLFAGRSSFTDDDLELARQLAVAARGALERGRLFEAERSARALAQQLARTGGELATELEPSAVLEEVVEEGASLLAADAASVRVLSGDELVVTASTEPVSEPDRTASTAWPAGDIVQSRAPLALADATAGGRPLEGEPFLAAGHVAYLGVPLFGPEGAPRGVLAVYSTRPRAWLPEEVEALAALAANASAALSNAELYQRVAVERERSVAILANIADGIVAVDREGKVVLWNAAAAQITGISEEEAIGRTPVQVLQRNLESDEPVPLPNRLVSIPKGGDEISLSLSEAVMTDPSGAVAGRIFAFRDISPERVVDQMKSDFVSAVSHDLRSPLTSIYGFAETLLRQDVEFGEAERRIFLGYIASESERLTRIVDTLLNVAQVDTGDLQVQLARIDVGSVLSEVVEAAKAISTNGHEFVVELDAAPLEAEADREKVRQILDQLIENAMKFSPSGGRVTLAARRRSDAVEVRVADEGIGIPDAQQARIFTKFFRADPEGPEGAGLGLFIAQGLVNAMGGRIWVDSAEGKGSSFTFELPLPRRGA
jgi:PAS domain S-box-containing protein